MVKPLEFAESSDESDQASLEMLTGVVACLQVRRPVFLIVIGPVEVDPGNDFDVERLNAFPFFVAKTSDAVKAIGFGVLDLVPSDILLVVDVRVLNWIGCLAISERHASQLQLELHRIPRGGIVHTLSSSEWRLFGIALVAASVATRIGTIEAA
jgi:hypothetical protein